jgi:hypothetical protein
MINGKLSEESLQICHSLLEEFFDFTRCERSNGTFYGSRGKCRQGTEVGPREQKPPLGKERRKEAQEFLKQLQNARGKKPGRKVQKPEETPKATTTEATPKQMPKPAKDPNKKKQIVDIKRAAPGGEYGPDGHFYPGGAWMPAAEFRGNLSKQKSQPELTPEQKAAYEKARAARAAENQRTRVIRQREPEPPSVHIDAAGPKAPANLPTKAQKNDDRFFNSKGTLNEDVVRDVIKNNHGGAIGNVAFPAALAHRIPESALQPLWEAYRSKAKDKDAFDEETNFNGQSSWRTADQEMGYNQMKRAGALPGISFDHYRKADALLRAVDEAQYGRQNEKDDPDLFIQPQPGRREANGNENYIYAVNKMLARAGEAVD